MKQAALRPQRLLVFLAAFFMISSAEAAVTPLSVGIVPPVQFPSDDFSITGLRLSVLWGRHRDVYGLDFGLVGNVTEQDFVGVGISGLFNRTKGMTTAIGLQAAGIANVNTQKTDVYGAQLALGLNMNTATSKVAGLQLALANLSGHTSIYGVQAGVYNKAQVVYGVQIGLVNVAESLHGIQIGLVKFHSKGMFTVSPILNVGF